MKTLLNIRMGLSLDHKEMSHFLNISTDKLIELENKNLPIRGKAVAKLKLLELCLDKKPATFKTISALSCIDYCKDKMAMCRYKKQVLDRQLETMQHRFKSLNHEHTRVTWMSLNTELKEDFRTSMNYRKFQIEERMANFSGVKEYELKLKIFLISAELESLNQYLEENDSGL